MLISSFALLFGLCRVVLEAPWPQRACPPATSGCFGEPLAVHDHYVAVHNQCTNQVQLYALPRVFRYTSGSRGIYTAVPYSSAFSIKTTQVDFVVYRTKKPQNNRSGARLPLTNDASRKMTHEHRQSCHQWYGRKKKEAIDRSTLDTK